MECVQVCDDDALRAVPQTADSVKQLQEEWDFWLDLPNTPRKYICKNAVEIRVAFRRECVKTQINKGFSGASLVLAGALHYTLVQRYQRGSLYSQSVNRSFEHCL